MVLHRCLFLGLQSEASLLLTAQTELAIRLGGFAGVFLVMAMAEVLAPCRTSSVARGRRWAVHFTLLLLNSCLARFLIPLTAAGMAIWAQSTGFGLLHLTDGPYWLEFLLAVLLLDLAIYGQHVLFHYVPWFWKLHLVHHADLDFDVTTGLRFHTLEILLSALIKLAAVALLGVPALAVVLFEVLLNAGAMFSHSNVRLPAGLDRGLRWFIVTPDMHRVHHSVIRDETNSNYGFHLPWWDYLFRTYRAQPRDGHTDMIIGLENYRDPKQTSRLGNILRLPWLTPAPAPVIHDRSS